MTEHSADTVEVTYTNWRGKTAVRRLILGGVRYGTTDWHKEPTWLINAFDVDHAAQIWKEYDLTKMNFTPSLTVEDAAKVLPDAEWRQTNGMIYNLVDSATGWENGERPKINQYMINFSRQNSAGGSDGELSELQAFVFAALRAIADTPKEGE